MDRGHSPQAIRVIEVTIERIVPGGAGLAHDDGKVVLTPLTAPGDRVRVRIVRDHERVAFGEIEEIVEGGPERVDPPCPYYGRCGGCDVQHLSYQAQLRVKVDIVRDSFRRIAGIDLIDVPIVGTKDPWGYRSRAEWQRDASCGAIGYFARGSHTVIDVSDCLVVSPNLASALSALRQELADGKLSPNARAFHAAEAGGSLSILPPVGRLRAKQLVSEVYGFQYRHDAACFFQANTSLLPALVEEVVRFAEPGPRMDIGAQAEQMRRSTAIDLYCGVGLFTLPLATRFERVIGVEVHAHAAAYARQNAKTASMDNVRIAAMPVGRWLDTRGHAHPEPDLVVLDPPRSGVDSTALAGLVRLRPWHITYVSCDPATLARDLKRLLATNYELRDVVAIDMFPQTHHVEAVAHLQRKD